MNFNYTHKNEVILNKKLITELINLYGIETKLIITDKNNVDPVVFGDWSSIVTDNAKTFVLHVLPENAEDMEHSYNFGDFGFNNMDSFAGFISAKEFERYGLSIKILLSSLIVLPSNKVLEITDVEHQVPGINHLWSYADAKSAYKLTLRTYEFKLHDEMDSKLNLSTETDANNIDELIDTVEDTIEDYDSLDNYFDTLIKEKNDIEYEAEIKESSTAVEKGEIETKPISKNSEKDPFGW